jgi:putative membrane protein
MRWLLAWVANAAALLILTYLYPAVQVASFGTALLVAVVLGLINLLVRPILVLLTLPVTLLTFGLFLLVINGTMFLLADKLINGFHINGFWPAVLGALVYSLISWLLQTLLGLRKG